MKKRVFALLLCGAASFALLCESPCLADATQTSGWNSSYENLLDEWIEARTAKLKIPGLGVAIVHGGKVLYCKGVGFADIAEKRPVTAKTRFRIGSQSKLFTALAIMRLVERNELRLDHPVAVDWLPSIKTPDQKNANITIRQLLTHTSGLSSMTVGTRPFWNRFPFPDEEELKRDLVELRPQTLFHPNEKLKYSNLGYVLLGEVLETKSGQSYADHIKQNVLVPMGLMDTSIDVECDDSLLATGYEPWDGEQFKEVRLGSAGAMVSATGFTSTPSDMAKFLLWQLKLRDSAGDHADSPVTGATLREMQRPKRMTPDLSFGHGLCFCIVPTDDGVLVGHGGQMPGFFSHSAIDVKNKIGIVLLANGMRCPVNPGETGSIMDALFGLVRTAVENDHPAGDSNPNWNAYYGRYRSMWGTLQVMSLNGALTLFDPEAAEPLATRHVLEPVEKWGAHSFRAKESTDNFYLGERFEFENFSNGRAQNLRDPGADFPRVQ